SALALHSFNKGESEWQALARVKMIHFDYSEANRFDAKMRLMIPFWTFMSRNLPLQVQQMVLNPKMYQEWRNLRRNLGAGIGPQPEPEYFRDAQGVYIG